MGVGKREEMEGGENEDEIFHPMTSLKLQPTLYHNAGSLCRGGNTVFRAE